jgi:altronate hydrolase
MAGTDGQDPLISITLPPIPGKVTALSQMAIHLHADDDVAVATADLPARMALAGPEGEMVVRRLVPRGHKVAVRAIADGAPVRRYGQIIGFATTAIAAGDHVHTQNLGVRDFARDPAIGADARPPAMVPVTDRRQFLGYARADGRAGTRNYVAVIGTVNCSATAVSRIAAHFREDARERYPHVDGVAAFAHRAGCGARYGGPEIGQLQRTLAGFARHPNVSGYVLVGLGCEINQVADLVAGQELAQDGAPLLVIQDEGGLANTVAAGIDAVERLLARADACRRTPQPVGLLTVALQCGGSDGWSGVTANPALGFAADEIVRQGGTVVLAETPEVYGAEHMLTRRAATPEAGQALLERIRWWEHHTAMLGCAIDNNPSPGNKAGGLTTIYEKSLGAIAKSGSTPLNAVYQYGERITAHGFVHMDSPGYDPVSVTGQVAGGCNLVAFTTGRGSVFGFKPAPCLKIATTSDLYRRLRGDMDVNAGVMLEGTPLAQVGTEIFERLLAVASGEPTLSERQDVGEQEFNPWILGATL